MLWPRNHFVQLLWNSADQWTQNTSAQKSHHLVIAKTDMQEEIYRKSSHSCLCCADTSHPSWLCQGLAVGRLPTLKSWGAQTVAVSNPSWAKWAATDTELCAQLLPCALWAPMVQDWEQSLAQSYGHSQDSGQRGRKSWGLGCTAEWIVHCAPSLQLNEARLCVGNKLTGRKDIQANETPFWEGKR